MAASGFAFLSALLHFCGIAGFSDLRIRPISAEARLAFDSVRFQLARMLRRKSSSILENDPAILENRSGKAECPRREDGGDVMKHAQLKWSACCGQLSGCDHAVAAVAALPAQEKLAAPG